MKPERFVVILLLFFWVFSKAQFSDSVRYHAGFISTGTFNRANSQTSYLFNNAAKVSARKKNVSYNFLNKWLYGKLNQQTTNNDYTSTFDINLYQSLPHFNYWGLFNYTSSYSLKVRSQLQTGIGAAYNVVNKKYLVLNVSDGFLYEYSDIVNTDNAREVYYTLRNSFRLKVSGTVKKVFRFTAIGFYQPSLIRANDYILRSDVTMAVKLRNWISLTANLTYNKMSRTQAENFFFTYGVTLERYF